MLFRRRLLAYKLMKLSSKINRVVDDKLKSNEEYMNKVQEQVEIKKQNIEEDINNLK